MTVSVQYASEHLEQLLAALDAGSSVIIERGEKPSVLLQSQPSSDETRPRGKRILGAGRGLLRVPSDEEWEQMDKEWRASYMHKFEGPDGV